MRRELLADGASAPAIAQDCDIWITGRDEALATALEAQLLAELGQLAQRFVPLLGKKRTG